MTFKSFIIKNINKFLNIYDYSLSKNKKNFDIYKYKNYEEYKKIQIETNYRKIDRVFADDRTLKLIIDEIKSNFSGQKVLGICHGTRNGYEQKFFIDNLDCEIIGTEISDNAEKFKNTIMWDFHDRKKEWENKFNFLYSNSLDQSFNPDEALEVWFGQIIKNGIMIIEHSDTSFESSLTDPFSVDQYYFSYFLSKKFSFKASIKIIETTKPQKKRNGENIKIWLYIIKKLI